MHLRLTNMTTTKDLKDIMSLKVLDAVVTPDGTGQVRNIGNKVQVALTKYGLSVLKWYELGDVRKVV